MAIWLLSFFLCTCCLTIKEAIIAAPPNITVATPNTGCPFNAPNPNAPNVAVTSPQVILLVVFIVKKGKIKYKLMLTISYMSAFNSKSQKEIVFIRKRNDQICLIHLEPIPKFDTIIARCCFC